MSSGDICTNEIPGFFSNLKEDSSESTDLGFKNLLILLLDCPCVGLLMFLEGEFEGVVGSDSCCIEQGS